MTLQNITKDEYDQFLGSFLEVLKNDYRCGPIQELILDPATEVKYKAYRSRIWYIVSDFIKRDAVLTMWFRLGGQKKFEEVRKNSLKEFKDILFSRTMQDLPLELNNDNNIAKIIVKWRLAVGK